MKSRQANASRMAVTVRDLYALENMSAIMQEYFWQRDIDNWYKDGKLSTVYSKSDLVCNRGRPRAHKRQRCF
jgi:hypothetical protein